MSVTGDICVKLNYISSSMLFNRSLFSSKYCSFSFRFFFFSPIAAGKPIPTELRKDAEALKKQIDLEVERTALPKVSDH